MEKRFKGTIRHTEETIRLLYKTEYHVYEKMRLLTRVVIGAAMIVLALAAGLPLAAQAILLMIGCWLLVSRDFPSTSRADKVVEARHGVFPVMTCTFTDGGVRLEGEGGMDIQYSQFQRLIEDDKYLYLFLGKGSACMVDRATVEPGPSEKLMEYVEEKTGLEWGRDKSLLSMNLRDIRQAVKDRRRR